jgi:hypothetical protein
MNTKFITNYLKEGAFVYNGAECDSGGVGYIINNGFENIVKNKKRMNVFDIIKNDEDIEELKKIMSDPKNEIIKISDVDMIIKTSATTFERFETHVYDYTNEVIVYRCEETKSNILYHWNI